MINIQPCYALVSGGKDSLSTACYLHEQGKLLGCVYLKTGIATPDSLPFVHKTCSERGWPLDIYETQVSYDDLVIKYGFPGPVQHSMFMNYLKGRCIQQFKKVHPLMPLASGVRTNESARRLLRAKAENMWEGVKVFAPIIHWTTNETWAYFKAHNFERAPAYSTLQISGDCLCGAFAREDEPAAIRTHYPEVWKRITALQVKVKKVHDLYWEWGWGWRAPRHKDQLELYGCAECGDTTVVAGKD